MKITLDYRNPTPSHCDVAVFVNGALAGVLTLRQEEVDVFQDVILKGLCMPGDRFEATGDPGELASSRMFAKDFPDEAKPLVGCGKGHANPMDCPHLQPGEITGVFRCGQCGYTASI